LGCFHWLDPTTGSFGHKLKVISFIANEWWSPPFLLTGAGRCTVRVINALIEASDRRRTLTVIRSSRGWLDKDGNVHEKVYDAVWSGNRKPGPDGKVPSVGSTVDVQNATWSNTIGAPELITVRKDPEFDPSQPAFYYRRVIEIPTPRWTAYDAKRFGVTPLPGTAMTITERAYTSPIWYNPAK
jgi:hypothetical protein